MNYNVCITTPIEDSGDYGPVGPNFGGGGSGGPGNPIYLDPSGYFFDPIGLTIGNYNEFVRNERAANLWQSLTTGPSGEREWASTHPEQYSSAVNYLLDHYTPELAEFIHTTITQINDNNLEVLDTDFLDDQITDDLPPCVAIVLSDIKTLTNGKFGNVIKKFASVNPLPTNYNWNITSTSINDLDQPAYSEPSVLNNTVTTRLNSNLMFISTDLSLARTFIHECLHAYLTSVYRYKDIDKAYVPLPETYATQFGGTGNGDQFHHQFFSTYLVQPIAEALMEYGTTQGYNLTPQYCTDMAWAGLQGTAAYLALPNADRLRIESTLFAEMHNNNDNAAAIFPIGTHACP